MEIRIRRARRNDYEALAALCGWPSVEDNPARSVRMFRRTIADLAYDVYVAEEDGRPIGIAAVSYVRELAIGGQRATLEELVVDPQRRRAGVGRRLLEFVVARAVRRGARAFEARPAESAVIAFLEHTGLRACGTRYARELARR